MKSIFKRTVAALLAAVVMVTPAAAYTRTEAVEPGQKVGIAYSEFFDSKGNMLDAASDFTDKNFAIIKKTVSKGSNLVKSFKINNRSHDVEITFDDKTAAAPNAPNVIIKELAVRSTRAIKDGNYTIIKSGVTYTFDGELAFRVGMDKNDREMIRDGDTIDLNSGDSEYVRWIEGDSYGTVSVEYGELAMLQGRVYENDKIMYGFDDHVDDELLDRNPNAYLQGLNIKGTTIPNTPKLYIMASKSDYIYENFEGTLKTVSGLKWSEEDYAWVVTLNKGRNFIISDSKLRSAPYGSGINESSSDDRYVEPDYDKESSSSGSHNYYNPDTGGGSGSVVAVAAIVAILAIAVLSIVLSTLLSAKGMRNNVENCRTSERKR